MPRRLHPEPQSLVLVVLFVAALFVPALANAEPAVWVVKGPHATVYLFGTIHALQKDDPWRSPKIDAASSRARPSGLKSPTSMTPRRCSRSSCNSVWIRPIRSPPSSLPINSPSSPGLQTVLAFPAAKPCSSRSSPGSRPSPQHRASHAGWLRSEYGVEMELKPEFVKANKPVKGFETAEQQMRYFADMPEKTQIDFLSSELDDFDSAIEKFKQMLAAWSAGDVDALDKLNNADFRDKYPELFQILVVKRNQKFTTQIEDLLKGDSVSFVAIGAGHLVGKDGVPAMLEKAGLQSNPRIA